MTVEDLVRESMSAYADGIEPKAESFVRIADRTQGGGRIRWLRFMPAALALAAAITVVAMQVLPGRYPVVQLAIPTPAQSPALDASYTSPNGDWTFDYPKEWTLREGNAVGWLVFNFAPQNLHEFPGNGEILIRWGMWGIELVPQVIDEMTFDNGKPKATQEIFDRVCARGGLAPQYTILDCRMVEINGRIWVRWLGDHKNEKLLSVSAILNGKVYRASANVGAGDRQSALLEVADRVFETFVIR